MVLYLTYSEAKRLINCMDRRAAAPFNPNYRWFALYGAKRQPANAVYGVYSKDDMGVMGIFARQRPPEPEHELEAVGEVAN